MTDKGEKGWVEYLRFITPILITIMLFLITSIKSDITLLHGEIKDIDQKLFKHLTNDDIHAVRSMIVDKETFALYQVMRDKQMGDLREGLNTRIDSLRQSMDRVITLLDGKGKR